MACFPIICTVHHTNRKCSQWVHLLEFVSCFVQCVCVRLDANPSALSGVDRLADTLSFLHVAWRLQNVVTPQYWPYKSPQPLCGAMKYLRLLEWRNKVRTVIYSVVHSVHIVSRLSVCSGRLAGRDYRLLVLQCCSYSVIITALWDMTHPVDVKWCFRGDCCLHHQVR